MASQRLSLLPVLRSVMPVAWPSRKWFLASGFIGNICSIASSVCGVDVIVLLRYLYKVTALNVLVRFSRRGFYHGNCKRR